MSGVKLTKGQLLVFESVLVKRARQPVPPVFHIRMKVYFIDVSMLCICSFEIPVIVEIH